jgi:hypothetical protein
MNLISIYEAAGQLEADMIKAFLEAQEIPVVLNQESIGRTIGLSAGRLGEVHILVPDSQAAKAKNILKEMFEGKFELGDEEDHPDEDLGTHTA